MPLEEFIITVFCLVDDTYHNLLSHPVRKRGTPPKLTDSEVITMEIVGEWLGRHTDKAIWTYFHQHWLSLFPSIPSRPQFARQAANLWAIKDKIHSYIVTMLGADTSGIYLIDGFPVDVCVTTRVKRSRLFKGEAAFGYCASKKKHFYRNSVCSKPLTLSEGSRAALARRGRLLTLEWKPLPSGGGGRPHSMNAK